MPWRWRRPKAVADFYGMQHFVIKLPTIHGSALTDADVPLPEGRDLAGVTGVAPSYVPARNLLFLAKMATLQDAYGPGALWLGVHHDDHTGYPDCRPEFVAAADQAVRLGTRYQLRVQAPFVEWSKADDRPLGSGARRSLRVDLLLLPGPSAGLRRVRHLPGPSGGVRRRRRDRPHTVRAALGRTRQRVAGPARS